MSRPCVFVVDDEAEILELVEYNLVHHGFEVTTLQSGEAALEAVRERQPDAIVLDLMLPGVDGLEVCRRLRAAEDTHHVPIVMLTARGEDSDVVAGLDRGADDYVTKPFSPRVLVARVRSVLRRQPSPSEDQAALTVGDLVIHSGRHEVTIGGRLVPLTGTEFRMLEHLARSPGWVFSRQQIIDVGRGRFAAVTERSVDVHVLSIRRKLGARADLIETVRGVGYRFKSDVAGDP